MKYVVEIEGTPRELERILNITEGKGKVYLRLETNNMFFYAALLRHYKHLIKRTSKEQ